MRDCRQKRAAESRSFEMKYRAYIDIETTGLSYRFADLTIIGIALEKNGNCRIVQLIGVDLSDERLLAALDGVDELYSYNGSRFDLPFIRARLGVDLNKCFRHTDLMYDCWRNKFKGGLKAVERQLGIVRRLKQVDGYVAVELWYDYVNNHNQQALSTLLEYNREDIVNLQVLRRKLQIE
jgi:uncharacterized protein YprB with RNaseH-like and TPR domain